MFLNYVTMERVRPGQVTDLPGDVTLVLRTTIKKLKGCRRTVHLETRPQRNRKQLEDCDYRLTTEDVDAFRSSSIMVNASRLLESAQQCNLTMSELCLVRDMMIADLTIQTGTRPGALVNATINDFETVKEDPRTKMRVMLIPDHKRGVAGPAPVTTSEVMYQHMQRYSYILPQFGPSRDVQHLFLMSDGKPFVHGSIYRRISEIWTKSGVRRDLRVTATNISKWIVTVCHQKKIEGAHIDEGALRLAMCHSNKTAETFYLREDMTEEAARATKIIAQCARGATPPPPPQPRDKPGTSLETTTTNSEAYPPPMIQLEDRAEVTQPTRSLSLKEKTIVSNVFADIISSNSKVTLAEITAGIRDSVPLRRLDSRDVSQGG